MWSEYFEGAIKRIAIRKAPLWNQGLLEGAWFIRFDSRLPPGQRVLAPMEVAQEGKTFFLGLLAELKLREPAVPFSKPVIGPTFLRGAGMSHNPTKLHVRPVTLHLASDGVL